MMAEQWLENYEVELDQAVTARQKGKEGMARVCARRAAGWVVGEYLNRRGIIYTNPSAYERLKFLEQLPDVPNEIKQVTAHFILRINPDHELPINVDLIQEAIWLKAALLDRPAEPNGDPAST
jgi:hypothetical protein